MTLSGLGPADQKPLSRPGDTATRSGTARYGRPAAAPAPVKRTVPPPAPVGPVTPRTFCELLVGSAAWTSAMTTCSPSVSPVRISASPPPTAPTVTVFSVTAPLVRTPTRAEPEVTPGTAETGTVRTSDDDAVVIVVVA